MIAPESLGSNWATEQNESFVINLFRKVFATIINAVALGHLSQDIAPAQSVPPNKH